MDENGTQTWTLYDGSDPIMDFNSSGSLEMRYLNGPTGDLVDSVLARESSSGTVAWYLPDRLGTVRDLINNSGAIIDHIDFSAFGTVLDQSDPSEGDRMMGFAGMELDSVTGMNLAVYRVQNPGTGRWTSQDPLSFTAGDTDLYRYVENAPDIQSDGIGLEPLTWWDLVSKSGSFVNQAIGGAFVDSFWNMPGAAWDSRWAFNWAAETYPVDDLRAKYSEQQLVDANNCRYMQNNAARHIYWQAILTMHYGRGTAINYENVHEGLGFPSGGFNDGRVDAVNNEIGRRLGESIAKLPNYNDLTWDDIDAILGSIIQTKIAFAKCGNTNPASDDPVIDINDPRLSRGAS
jgi:RHS repeat-associated protein